MSVPFLYALYTLYALLTHFSCTLYALLWAGSLSLPSSPPFGAKNEGSDDHLHVRPLHRGRTQVAVQ